ncbi:MAG: hypothetical protein EBX52_14920, partial [Proteobacteria bacterium]|nr:hypothetical protein [Pseudomonadota bacterium]
PTRKLESISAEQIRRREEEALEALRRNERREEERLESLAKEREIAATYPDRFWYLGFGYGGKSSTVPLADSKEGYCCILLSIGHQWRLHRTFYLRGEYSFGVGKDSIKTGTYVTSTNEKHVTIHDFNLSLPYYLGDFRIGPEVGIQLNSYPYTGPGFNQTSYGVNIGTDRLRSRDASVGLSLKVRSYSKPDRYNGGVYVLGAFTFGAAVKD